MEEAKWAKREVKSSFTNYLHHSKCLLPKFLLENPSLFPEHFWATPFVGGKPFREGFCEASSMSQAWLVALKGKHVVQKPCNMSCSRYPCSWRLFPYLSPASSRETDGEIILSGEKSSRRATKPPITGVFLPVPKPSSLGLSTQSPDSSTGPALGSSGSKHGCSCSNAWPWGYLHPGTWADSSPAALRQQLKAFRTG